MNFFSAGDVAPGAADLLGRTIDANHEIGLRPEHLTPTDSANAVVQGTLELVENLGEYALVHMITQSGVEFIAKTEKPPAQSKGEVISFGIKPDLVHVFAKDTGLRV